MPALENLQWELFCQAYALSFNGTQSAIDAGYSAGDNNTSAGTQAGRLLENALVQARVRELVEQRVNEFRMEAVSLLKIAAQIATCNVKLAFNEDGSPKPISEIPDAVAAAISQIDVEDFYEGTGKDKVYIGKVRKYRFWSKDKQVELLGKHFKLWLDKLELSADKSLEDLLTRSWEAKKSQDP